MACLLCVLLAMVNCLMFNSYFTQFTNDITGINQSMSLVNIFVVCTNYLKVRVLNLREINFLQYFFKPVVIVLH